jgi:cysteine and histidine-rich domain-containing protein
VPVFHDALKGWSCCNKKSTDFSTFLSYPGCTKGQHSNIKPVEPEKVKPEKTDVPEIVVRQPIRPQEPTERPSELENLVDLQMTISPSLVNNLQNIKTSSLITYGKL